MKLSIEELHLVRLAIGNLKAHDNKMLEIGKLLNDEDGCEIYADEIEKLDNLMKKLYTMIEEYYDTVQ